MLKFNIHGVSNPVEKEQAECKQYIGFLLDFALNNFTENVGPKISMWVSKTCKVGSPHGPVDFKITCNP